jgi:hypothetical protein
MWTFALLAACIGSTALPLRPVSAAEATFASTTYLRSYQRPDPSGGKDRYVPLYEYLSGDATRLSGDLPLAFHFAGWGRLDLATETGSGRTGGDFDAAYLDYRHPNGNGEARLGRFFLTEGVASDTIDGVFVKATTAPGFGGALFAGKPVEQGGGAIRTGRSIYGGRAFFAASGFAEIGASFLKEKGDFPKVDGGVDDRTLAGGDLWLRPGGPIEFNGQASYNLSTKGFANQRYTVRLKPGGGMDVLAGYESYDYRDLFMSALNPAFHASVAGFDNNDKVKVTFVTIDWEFVKGLVFEAGLKNMKHAAADPGTGNRGEAGLRWAFNDKKDSVGASASVMTADRDENEYSAYRLYGMWSPGDLRLALDLLMQRYKVAFADNPGRKDAAQAVASAGYQLRPDLKVSGDVTWSKSPRLNDDYAGLLKVAYNFGLAAGGGK